MDNEHAIENIEIKLLLEAIHMLYGYDFHAYSQASMKRRVRRAADKFHCRRISELQVKILHDETFFPRLLPELTVTTTEMFRDPAVYKKLIDEVFPVLRTYPSIKVWHAGCSTGEEVYSVAILLKEEGLYDQSLIYATDINPAALKTAQAGVYPLSSAQKYTKNYHDAGRHNHFSNYYLADCGSIIMDQTLKENIVFAEHNLLIDDVFSEVHLIMCRNVLIYFDRESQKRVLNLFWRSLVFKGYLCLGTKEAILSESEKHCFMETVKGFRIFQNVKNVS